RIYVQVDRPTGGTNVPSIPAMSPYAMVGNNAPNHNVIVARLPQDTAFDGDEAAKSSRFKEVIESDDRLATLRAEALERGYASLTAHSLGTGRSTGCPTVGDEKETLGSKAVI